MKKTGRTSATKQSENSILADLLGCALAKVAQSGYSVSDVRVSLDGVGEIAVTDVQLPFVFSGPIQDKAERVRRAKQFLAEAAKYPKGCSEFVCKVLDIPWESANDLMGNPAVTLGNPPYDFSNVTAGDIVGWKKASASGHVAVYVGSGELKPFIDVRDLQESPRALTRWGDNDVVTKSSRF